MWSWKNIFNSLCIGKVWWSWKNWFLTVAHLGRCGGLEITDFEQFVYSEGVVVLKELIFNSFYIQKVWWSWKNWFWMVYIGRIGKGFLTVWWSWKNWFLTVAHLGRCGGLEITDFEQFLYLEGIVVLKEVIFNRRFYRTDFEQFLYWKVWWSWKNWFLQFLYSEGMVVLKELIFHSFYIRKVWWS